MHVWVKDSDCGLREDNLTSEVSKWAQTDESVGEGRHDMPLHCCGGKGWHQSQSSASHGSLLMAVGNMNSHCGCSRVVIGKK
jgi:hypothetical protein